MAAASSSVMLIIIKQALHHNLDIPWYENLKTKINLEFQGFHSIVIEDVALKQTMHQYIRQDWNRKMKLLTQFCYTCLRI